MFYVISFWDEFGNNGCKTYKSPKSKSETLNALRSIVEAAAIHRVGSKRNSDYRQRFNRVKYKRHSLKSHKLCFACGSEASVRHHIVPLMNGGRNSKKNLVSLCSDCHAHIHPWLSQ